MKFYNSKIKRNILYQYISSIEIDCRHKIVDLSMDFKDFESKAIERFCNDYGNDVQYTAEELINYLDFGDYVKIFQQNKNLFSCEKRRLNELCNLLENLVTTRNRVMHSRPLDIEDEDKVNYFIGKYEKYLDILEFSQFKQTDEQFKKNPSFFIEKRQLKESIYITEDVVHNLPFVDFDDTGFIGREQEKNQLLKKIKGPYPVISIIGDGGIGKTSLLLNCLYDYIASGDIPYKRIIWISLKTKALQDGEFKCLKNSFKDFQTCIDSLDLTVEPSNISTLVRYMEQNSTLLIIDNLETINPLEIKDFLEELPFGSKVIITSRIGIGEFENRFKLGSFNEKDALIYFRRLIKVYDVKSLRNINDEKALSYVKKLFYSPLCIKWFVINVGKGGNIPNLLFNKDELIDFCLSNVFTKLSSAASFLINILLYKTEPISPAEIVYISQMEYDECMQAINELIACNFLEQNELGLYYITIFSRDYLRKNINTNYNDDMIKKNINKLDFEQEKLNEMEKLFLAATQAAPTFADTYKVAAYLYAKYKKYNLTIQYYEIAIECENNPEKKAMVKNQYAGFIITYEISSSKIIKYLDEARSVLPLNSYILSNYGRYYKYRKEFDTAEEAYMNIIESNDIKKSKVQIANGYSEILDIKFRKLDLELYNGRSVTKKQVKEIITYLYTIPVQFYSYSLCKVIYKLINLLLYNSHLIELGDLEHLFKKSIKYILYVKDELDDYDDFIRRANSILTYKNMSIIINDLYVFDSVEYGKVIVKKEDYFFISQQAWTKKGVYCNYRNFLGDITELEVGDYVEFVPNINRGKRYATNARLIKNNTTTDSFI